MGYALGFGVVLVLIGTVALWLIAWAVLNFPHLPRPGQLGVHDAVSIVQLVFASVAGAGALVALIVAYRRQRTSEAAAANDRTRVFNERFTAIAAQLGDPHPAVRLAGVHAMAGLADDWSESRQTCVDVLCAYLRLPYLPDPGTEAHQPAQLEFRANREVRHTAIRIIAAHLRPVSRQSWQGLNLDFTGVVFDGGDFSDAVFSGGIASFTSAVFSGGVVDFTGAVFSGGDVDFVSAVFSGGVVDFVSVVFSSGVISFGDAVFSGGVVDFGGAEFSGGDVSFRGAEFCGGEVDMSRPARWLHPPFLPQGIPRPGLSLPPESKAEGDVILLRLPGSRHPGVS